MESIRFLQGPVVFVMFAALLALERRIGFAPYDVISRRRHIMINTPITLLSIAVLGLGSFLVVLACHLTTFYSVGVSFIYKKHLFTALSILVDVIIFDLVNYFIHRSMHTVPFLWRIHRAHHSDQIVDVTTSFRLHPFENLYRVIVQFIFAAFWGLSATALGVYAILGGIVLCFSHANIKIQRDIEDKLALLFVSPFYHRIHHSQDRTEHDANYGIVFMFWDHLFKTFLSDSRQNKIGLKDYPNPQSIREVLEDPFFSTNR